MFYTVYRLGSGMYRPPVELDSGTLEECRKVGEDYLLELYGKLPSRTPSELDIWVEIEDEDGTVVEAIYPSHGRKSQFITKRLPRKWEEEYFNLGES